MYVLLLKSVSEEASGPQDDPYVQILSNAGFHADLIETLDFRYHTSELASYLSWRESHSAIVLSSPRAVTAIMKAGIKGQSTDLCFVVGPSTELQAKKAGFSPKGAQSGDAESLAKYIVSSFGSALSKPIFFPAGQLHREDVPRHLEKNGIKVNVVIAYSSYEKESMKERVRLNLCSFRRFTHRIYLEVRTEASSSKNQVGCYGTRYVSSFERSWYRSCCRGCFSEARKLAYCNPAVGRSPINCILWRRGDPDYDHPVNLSAYLSISRMPFNLYSHPFSSFCLVLLFLVSFILAYFRLLFARILVRTIISQAFEH